MSPSRRSRCRSSRLGRKCASASTAQRLEVMIRRIFTALILLPLAIIVISLAVANRENVVISFDPFDPAHPALTRALPLYLLMLMLLVGGVFVGGVAAWLRQGQGRRAAGLADAQALEPRREGVRLPR